MQSELSFLIDLLLEPKISSALREKLILRIREVEKALTCAPHPLSYYPPSLGSVPPVTGSIPKQAASTLALMVKHGDIPQASVPPAQAMAPIIKTPELNQVESAAREATVNLLKRKHRPLEVKA